MMTDSEIFGEVTRIAVKVQQARATLAHDHPDGFGAWQIMFGPRAFSALQAVKENTLLAWRMLGADEAAADRPLHEWSICGIRVAEDPDGPPDQWRLVGDRGYTIFWGDWPHDQEG
jgi:hypothetical protein